MTGAASSRSTKTVRGTIPGRVQGGRSLDSTNSKAGSSEPGCAAVDSGTDLLLA
jgi:hypothetical protein